ncbi:MAG: hypothetical protein NT080_06980 [Spirochaetes bacterium]|nr:hypothetical protein [Spirochaetota bacterium]
MSAKIYTVEDFMKAAASQVGVLQAAAADFELHRGEHETRMADLRRQFDETVTGMARLLLPVLSPEAIRRAAKLSAYAPLLTSDPMSTMQSEAKRLEADIARMEADPRYRDRLALRAPGVGKLARDLQELEEYRSSISNVIQRADHPRLERLLAAGYGTDQYKVGWWRMSYYADWKAGDEITERFPDWKSFGELRTELLKMRDDLGVYDQRIGELRSEIEAGEKLEKDHDAAALRLTNLASIHLAEWQGRLARYVVESPEVVADRLSGEPDLEALLKTVVGLGKKIDYLGQLATTQLDEPLEQVRALLEKLERDRRKFTRPKNAGQLFPADIFERRFRDRSEHLGKHSRRYDAASRTISAFTDYRQASFAEDFLWWDLMTDGRIDGDFIAEVEEFRRAHPDYVWRPEQFDDDRAAAAAAAADREDSASDRMTDAS